MHGLKGLLLCGFCYVFQSKIIICQPACCLLGFHFFLHIGHECVIQLYSIPFLCFLRRNEGSDLMHLCQRLPLAHAQFEARCQTSFWFPVRQKYRRERGLKQEFMLVDTAPRRYCLCRVCGLSIMLSCRCTLELGCFLRRGVQTQALQVAVTKESAGVSLFRV